MERNGYQSTPRSKGRRRRKAELLPFGAEDGPAPRYDDDNADGDVREGRAQAPESRPLRRDADVLRKAAASKETRRRSEIKQTALRQSKDDDERGKTAKDKTHITCNSLLLRPDVRRSSRSGERWWQDEASADANLET